ncbi:cyclase family protein [Microbacterium sp. NPDC058345]|uniref:cyclase family protein n=1 Tax=Microbacterium sp. NPDC058345 TaxID=3346455 RepID=UPI00365FE294
MHHELRSADIHRMLRERANWGRWGDDDQLGALNLVTAEKRVEAAALVRTGRMVSLSHPIPTRPRPDIPRPAQHLLSVAERGTGGIATDFYGIEYHGLATTHIDALAHAWDENGMWQGRDPVDELTSRGARWGGIERWGGGILTRGVLLDVPRFRNGAYVTHETPVHGGELKAIAASQGVRMRPGDAVFVYSGRAAWDAENPVWGSERTADGRSRRPGLHLSCLDFLRDHDSAVLGWDMLDAAPNPWGLPWTVHAAIFSYGMALIDNCLLEPLAQACAEEGRYDFMLTVAPLIVPGGTGSPVNPLASF